MLYVLFNLCRVYKPRQELAAEAGVVPHLRGFCVGNSSLKDLGSFRARLAFVIESCGH